jgi:hypothetical protein
MIKTITNKIANVIKSGIESSDIIQPPGNIFNNDFGNSYTIVVIVTL